MTHGTIGGDKPLLRWMDEGDPDLVPVMMADGRTTASSYFGVPLRVEGESTTFTGIPASPVTPEMVVKCSEETGIHFVRSLGYMLPFSLVEFMDDVDLAVQEERRDGAVRRATMVRTPAGEMSEVFITPYEGPAYWEENFVKGSEDLPALTHLVERFTQALLEDARAREAVKSQHRDEAAKWPARVPFFAVMSVPSFEVTSQLYMAHATAFYLLVDETAAMERIFEAVAQSNAVLVECAAEAGADFVFGAINGLEIYSPAIYERYFVPEATALHEAAHRCGLRGWVHTCGRMGRLIEMGVYERMKVDVLESLSHPPLGDVTDLPGALDRLGPNVVTRGGVNVGLFYESDPGKVRERAKAVIEQTRGHRHMIGDTNDSFPTYPRENILAFVEEVEGSGRMLRA
jgi:hypothetical protein